MSKIELHPGAEADLDEIWDYIAEDSVSAADRVIAGIAAALEAVVPFPQQGFPRPDLTARPLRFITVYEYLIAYAPDANPLWVVAVIHARRNPRLIASVLRDRR